MADPGVSETLVEQLADNIRQAIRQGRLVPGQRLVVAELASMFGASAGPVREAIRRLTGEGLLISWRTRALQCGPSMRAMSARSSRCAKLSKASRRGSPPRTFIVQTMQQGWRRLAICSVRRSLRAIRNSRMRGSHFMTSFMRLPAMRCLRETALRLTYPLYRLFFNEQVGPNARRSHLASTRALSRPILSGDGFPR